MWLIDPSTHSGDSALENLAVLWTGSKSIRFGMGGVSPVVKMVTFCQQVDFMDLRPHKSMAFCLVPPGLPSYLGVFGTATCPVFLATSCPVPNPSLSKDFFLGCYLFI